MAFRIFVIAACLSTLSSASVGPLRVEVELRRLNNSQGILENGQQCDVTSTCDMRIKGYLDTDNPLAPWPGSKPADKWTLVFQKDNDNMPIINKIVSRDVCTEDIQRANLRLNVVDVDSLTKNDLIEQFECMIAVENVAVSMSRAAWSTERPCDATFNPTKLRLNFRFRLFQIQPSECGQPPTGASSRT